MPRRPFDTAFDPLLTEQLAVAKTAQRYVAEQALVIPLVELAQVVSLSPTVRDVVFDASAVLRLQNARAV